MLDYIVKGAKFKRNNEENYGVLKGLIVGQ
jgi:hypothetical protein